mmetsp:Transcript_11068/g.30564  ORF Transcript_11068/g.30564 Transcript_11068/m.30564 type:complete len:111 (-) Transcript_11068:7-339(-)
MIRTELLRLSHDVLVGIDRSCNGFKFLHTTISPKSSCRLATFTRTNGHRTRAQGFINFMRMQSIHKFTRFCSNRIRNTTQRITIQLSRPAYSSNDPSSIPAVAPATIRIR